MNKAVCIAVYYKMFSGSTKQKQFSQRQRCYISFPLVLKSGSFRLNSSPVSWEKVCVRVYWQSGLKQRGIWSAEGTVCFSVFLPVPQSFSVRHTVQCNYRSWNSLRIKTMVHSTNLPDEGTETKLIGDNDQMRMLKTQESDEDEDYDEKEQPSPPG